MSFSSNYYLYCFKQVFLDFVIIPHDSSVHLNKRPERAAKAVWLFVVQGWEVMQHSFDLRFSCFGLSVLFISDSSQYSSNTKHRSYAKQSVFTNLNSTTLFWQTTSTSLNSILENKLSTNGTWQNLWRKDTDEHGEALA